MIIRCKVVDITRSVYCLGSSCISIINGENVRVSAIKHKNVIVLLCYNSIPCAGYYETRNGFLVNYEVILRPNTSLAKKIAEAMG